MRARIRNNLLIIVIITATIMALTMPHIGEMLKGYGLVQWSIVIIFLCQGAGLDAREAMHPVRYLPALAWGSLVSFAVAPVLGWSLMRVLGQHFGWTVDDHVGFLLMCAMAPTLVSGTVIAVQAGGNRTTAVIVTVILNLVAIVTVPLNLGWMIGTQVAISRFDLLLELVRMILVPALIGQLLRRKLPNQVAAYAAPIKYLPILLLGLTIFISLSSRVDDLRGLTVLRIVALALPALAVHLALLGIGWFGGRSIFHLPVDSLRSVALVCSQKTLPVAVAIWSSPLFFNSYPTAIIAPILFHMSQIYCDGIIAKLMARHAAAATQASTLQAMKAAAESASPVAPSAGSSGG